MYSGRRKANRLEVVMNADIALIDRFCEDASAFLSEAGFSGQEFEFNIMAREALGNAIVHGSGMNAAREVRVLLEREGGRLTLRVRDEGPGWDWRKHDWSPPPPADEGGRGLCIVRYYSDDVRFNEQGNEIIITKRLDGQEKGMETSKQQAHRKVVMGPSLSAATLEQYRSEFKRSVDAGVHELELDCGGLEVVDSMGIGLLVATHNSLVKQGGELVMTRTSEPIYNLMSTMRLNRHFTVRRD